MSQQDDDKKKSSRSGMEQAESEEKQDERLADDSPPPRLETRRSNEIMDLPTLQDDAEGEEQEDEEKEEKEIVFPREEEPNRLASRVDKSEPTEDGKKKQMLRGSSSQVMRQKKENKAKRGKGTRLVGLPVSKRLPSTERRRTIETTSEENNENDEWLDESGRDGEEQRWAPTPTPIYRVRPLGAKEEPGKRTSWLSKWQWWRRRSPEVKTPPLATPPTPVDRGNMPLNDPQRGAKENKVIPAGSLRGRSRSPHPRLTRDEEHEENEEDKEEKKSKKMERSLSRKRTPSTDGKRKETRKHKENEAGEEKKKSHGHANSKREWNSPSSVNSPGLPSRYPRAAWLALTLAACVVVGAIAYFYLATRAETPLSAGEKPIPSLVTRDTENNSSSSDQGSWFSYWRGGVSRPSRSSSSSTSTSSSSVVTPPVTPTTLTSEEQPKLVPFLSPQESSPGILGPIRGGDTQERKKNDGGSEPTMNPTLQSRVKEWMSTMFPELETGVEDEDGASWLRITTEENETPNGPQWFRIRCRKEVMLLGFVLLLFLMMYGPRMDSWVRLCSKSQQNSLLTQRLKLRQQQLLELCAHEWGIKRLLVQPAEDSSSSIPLLDDVSISAMTDRLHRIGTPMGNDRLDLHSFPLPKPYTPSRGEVALVHGHLCHILWYVVPRALEGRTSTETTVSLGEGGGGGGGEGMSGSGDVGKAIMLWPRRDVSYLGWFLENFARVTVGRPLKWEIEGMPGEAETYSALCQLSDILHAVVSSFDPSESTRHAELLHILVQPAAEASASSSSSSRRVHVTALSVQLRIGGSGPSKVLSLPRDDLTVSDIYSPNNAAFTQLSDSLRQLTAQRFQPLPQPLPLPRPFL